MNERVWDAARRVASRGDLLWVEPEDDEVRAVFNVRDADPARESGDGPAWLPVWWFVTLCVIAALRACV